MQSCLQILKRSFLEATKKINICLPGPAKPGLQEHTGHPPDPSSCSTAFSSQT